MTFVLVNSYVWSINGLFLIHNSVLNDKVIKCYVFPTFTVSFILTKLNAILNSQNLLR